MVDWVTYTRQQASLLERDIAPGESASIAGIIDGHQPTTEAPVAKVAVKMSLYSLSS